MTGGQFREVDFDLLADYVGGALHGTPAETEIAELIRQDPAWADAHVALATGVDAVRLDLASWGAEPAPMPSEVIDRLTSALTGASRPDDSDSGPDTRSDSDTGPDSRSDTDTSSGSDTGPDSRSDSDTDTSSGSGLGAASGSPSSGRTHPAGRPRRQLSGAPGKPGGGGTRQTAAGPGRRRRWSRRLAGPILIATVVASFAGFAVTRLFDIGSTADQGASTALDSAEGAAEPPRLLNSAPPPVVEPSAERVLATGTDYTPSSLSGSIDGLVKRAATPSAAAQNVPGNRSAGSDQRSSTPERPSSAPAQQASTPCCRSLPAFAGLERLADRSVLADCLGAIAATHGQGPVVVELVDYATFRGRAALVVVFNDRSGARWAWVTGPDCGSSASGADVTYRTRVG